MIFHKKFVVCAGLVLALLTSPLLAADAVSPQPAAAELPNDKAERVKLATDFADIKPIRDAVNLDIEAAAATVPPAEKEEFMRNVQARIDYIKLEQDSIVLMADMFTVEELTAMLTYYGSAAGKSAETKAFDYINKIRPRVAEAIDGALLDAQLGPERR